MYQIEIKLDLLSAVVSIFGAWGDLDVNHVRMCVWVMYGGVLCLSMSLGVWGVRE